MIKRGFADRSPCRTRCVTTINPNDRYNRFFHKFGIYNRESIPSPGGALADFDYVIDLEPDFVDAYVNRAGLHLDEGRLDEERRLLYVGITRAKELLVLSHSVQARRYGQVFAQKPSRFLEELPSTDLHREGADPEADARARTDVALTQLQKLTAMLG